MSVGRFFGKTGRGLAAAAGILVAIGLSTMPRPANAGGVSPGAAVGIGLGAFALGTVLSHPYYNPYYYPYGYYGYYPPPQLTIHRRRIIRIIRGGRQRLTRLRRADQAVTSPGN